MPASDLVNLSGLMDDAKCSVFVRQHRWPEGVRCPVCDSDAVIRDGCGDTQPCRQRYVLCLHLMGLNLSSRQIAGELALAVSVVQVMTEQLRHGLVAKMPAVELGGEVEVDEVYVVAAHKGQPEEVAKKGGSGAAASWQARRAAARWRRTSRRSSA